MSTEKQVYSTENQMAAIASYAAAHDFRIVRTYADEGRSGLRLKGRAALQAMLRDVLSGDPGYDAILVFDVSRWGRFQDTDESAHYEWICRDAGVQIHYCAELFDNDGSLASTIIKNLKRAMAGEYSRELSSKVWAAQSRLAAKGYKMGGTAGYGLRRLLIDRDGNHKQLLKDGEHKSITTDRIVLVPGDPTEVATVQRIFSLAATGLSNPSIANFLNDEGIPAPKGGRWSTPTVRAILRADRYIGANVYNRHSAKLGGSKVRNSQDTWVVSQHPFAPLVSRQRFRAVQSMRRGRNDYSVNELLRHLRGLVAEHGYLSSSVIDAAAPPGSKTYFNRFGSLRNAYDQIGYDIAQRDTSMPPAQAQLDLASEICELLDKNGRLVDITSPGLLLVIDQKIVIAPRIFQMRSDRGRQLWRIKKPKLHGIDFVLAAAMQNDVRQRLYLLPASRFGKSGKIDIGAVRNNMEAFEVWNLSLLNEMIDWHYRLAKSPHYARRVSIVALPADRIDPVPEAS
jgi:DNA invertase Pin-like site-specific DNA recombinase